ncbi:MULTISPECIES: IS66 family insertion sequence element accessory protein TnpB [Pelotomaculum]|uniref:IS66 family insertion sequence element accessory protein TnpB n=1 Tax=Pelotomaculum schinkii TaxID=78350 RepID=UPI0010669D91
MYRQYNSEVSNRQVYLVCGSTDLRRSIDGLAVLIKEAFSLNRYLWYGSPLEILNQR